MSGMIRRGIVAPLAVVLGVSLIAPAAQAQTEAELKRISSAYERAKAFEKQGKLAQAAQEYEQAVDLARRELGPEHPRTAVLMNNLAGMYQAMGRFADAEPLLSRGLGIREKQLGRDHPDVALSPIPLN